MIRKPDSRTLVAGALGVFVGAVAGYSLSTLGRSVDWSSTGTMIQGLAAMLAASAAAWGVNKWQQEIRFKRNVELAEKVLISVEGLARDLTVARSKTLAFEVDERVPGGVVLTRQTYELRHRGLTINSHSAELESMRNRVSVIFGEAHGAALASLLDINNTVHWSFVECIGTTAGVDDGRLELEALELLVPVAESLVPFTARGQGLSTAINERVRKVRELFKDSI